MFSLIKTMLYTAALRQGAGNAKRSVQRAVARLAAAAIGGLLALVGLGFLIAAGHEALADVLDPQAAKLICGGALILIGAIVIAASRAKHKPKPVPASLQDATGLPSGLLGPEVEQLLQRNAGTLAIGAFVAGLLLSARRR